MTYLQVVVLALVQGLTEFLPISSSAHLILVPLLSHWQDQGLAFDVSVHVGTLSAVVWYFRTEVIRLSHDWGRSCLSRKPVGESRLAWMVIWASIPVAVAGLLFSDIIETVLRSPLVIASTTIGFGLVLGLADRIAPHVREEDSLTWKDVTLIGLSQAVALIPGTSRSGITMTAGLFLGLTRQAAARFSFLLSIPAIMMAGSYKSLQLIEAGLEVEWGMLLLGAFLSGLTAYLCIHFFLKLLDRFGMQPFVWYRLFLGGILLYLYF